MVNLLKLYNSCFKLTIYCQLINLFYKNIRYWSDIKQDEMLPRLERVKTKENYPKEKSCQDTNNIVKLKIIRQFLDKERTENFFHFKKFLQKRDKNRQAFKRQKNNIRVGSPLAEINTISSPTSIGKFLNVEISKSGRNLRLSQLYDIQQKQNVKSQQLKRSFTNCKVR